MNFHRLYATANKCYVVGNKLTPKGIMIHSTGANNPYLKRYVGPDDGLLGTNSYKNYWNNYQPGGQSICCHAFIGKLKDGTIATYQILPWNYQAWHCGRSGNQTHLSFEICEDGLNDKNYLDAVYHEAIDLCIYLCKEFGLSEKDILDHHEGNSIGIASNHGDVAHWWSLFGYSMDGLRNEVKKGLSKTNENHVALYVVRKDWSDISSQIGAYAILDNAKRACLSGYKVFDENGTEIYENEDGVYPELYRVRKSWDDYRSQIGAFINLDHAKAVCVTGYKVYDENGKMVYSPEKKWKASDARHALRQSAGLETDTGEYDLNGDGKTTAAEARQILKNTL